jgi:hypothetical protein
MPLQEITLEVIQKAGKSASPPLYLSQKPGLATSTIARSLQLC